MKTLQDWVNQSPNKSTTNTLLQTIGLSKGKTAYYSYRWNLRHVDPRELDVYTTIGGNVITQEQAQNLL